MTQKVDRMKDDNNQTLKKWQEKIGAKILQWKDKLIHSGTDLVYYTLCATALYPVIETMQTGDPSFLLLLTADFGISLIANQIQSIKDAGEEKAPQLLQTQVKENPEIKEELDCILEKLDVIELARGAMTEEERAAFFEQFKRSLPKTSAIKLKDRRVFIQGDLKYSIVNTGDGVNITYYGPRSTHNEIHIHAPDPLETAEKARQEKIFQYLDALIHDCQILPLRPVGMVSTGDIEMTLDQIYIQLDVEDLQGINKVARTSALKIAYDKSRFVLLGDPGSGKSTFVKMLARSTALDWQQKSSDPILGTQCIPIILILRELAEDLRKINPEKPDEDLIQSQFTGQITKILTADKFGLTGFTDDFLRIMRNQQTLFIFDGMDELPQDLRKTARIWIETVIQHLRPLKAIVTCRIRSYSDETVIQGYRAFTLAPFNEDQITNFTLAWYRANSELTTPEKQEDRAQHFFQQIKADENIFDMAANPLLLTQMAVLHQRDTRLPDQRVLLFEEIVKLLLSRWQDHSGAHFEMSDDLTNLFKESDKVRLALEHLAFISHQSFKGKKGAADLPRLTALETLNQHFKDYGLAEEFLGYLDQRSGLLQGKGGTIKQADTYSFPHQTFQEYLAGCHLNRLSQHAKLRLLAEIAGEGDFWDVVFQLSIEERVHIGKDPNLVDLAEKICNYCGPDSENGYRMVYWSALLEKLLGEETIRAYDDPKHNITIGGEYLSTLREKLLTVATGIKLTPAEQIEAVDILESLSYIPVDLYSFVEIPGNESIPTFLIGKYPVTNAQYARFLKPENFTNQSLWMDLLIYASPEEAYREMGSTGAAGWDWLQAAIQDDDYLIEDGVLLPRYWWESRFGDRCATTPVVGVTWWEANAYTRWLHVHWDELEEGQQGLPNPATIRLPLEEEWVLAASGKRGGKVSERYAFGTLKTPKEEIAQYCNTEESGIRRTTPVWMYPQGASPNGVMDMSGNVWEWQVNLFQKDEEWQAIRGGSWNSRNWRARLPYRYHYFGQGDRLSTLGFRLVALPS